MFVYQRVGSITHGWLFQSPRLHPIWRNTPVYQVASRYPDWLQRGFHIITPNRQVLVGPYEHYKECFKHVGALATWGVTFTLVMTSSFRFVENPPILNS